MRPFEERRAISTPVVTDHDLNVAALPALSHLARTLPIASGFVGVSLALSEVPGDGRCCLLIWARALLQGPRQTDMSIDALAEPLRAARRVGLTACWVGPLCCVARGCALDWMALCCLPFKGPALPNARARFPQCGILFALCNWRCRSADLPTGGVRGSGRVGVAPRERTPGRPEKRISPLTTFPKIQVSAPPQNVKSPKRTAPQAQDASKRAKVGVDGQE